MTTKKEIASKSKLQLLISEWMRDVYLNAEKTRTSVEAEHEKIQTNLLKRTPTRSATTTQLNNWKSDISSSFKTKANLSSYENKINSLFNSENIGFYRCIYPVNFVQIRSSSIDDNLLNTLYPGTTWTKDLEADSKKYLKRTV